MNHATISRELARLRSALTRASRYVPTSIKIAASLALATAAHSMRNGDVSRAVVALDSAKALLDSFVA